MSGISKKNTRVIGDVGDPIAHLFGGGLAVRREVQPEDPAEPAVPEVPQETAPVIPARRIKARPSQQPMAPKRLRGSDTEARQQEAASESDARDVTRTASDERVATEVTERTPENADSPKRVRTTVHMEAGLADYMRDTVYALSGPGIDMTMQGFIDRAVRAEIKRLEKKYNEGARFPHRTGKIRTGARLR